MEGKEGQTSVCWVEIGVGLGRWLPVASDSFEKHCSNIDTGISRQGVLFLFIVIKCHLCTILCKRSTSEIYALKTTGKP